MNTPRLTRGLLLAATALFLAACDDDDSGSASLPGTWQATEIVTTDAAGAEVTSALPAGWSETLVLHPDGTFSFVSVQSGRTRTGAGLWGITPEGLAFANQRETIRPYRLDGPTLVLSGAVPEGPYRLRWRQTAAAE